MNARVVGTDSIAERFGALAQLREAGIIRHPAAGPLPHSDDEPAVLNALQDDRA